jgi:ATP-dependent Lon protease
MYNTRNKNNKNIKKDVETTNKKNVETTNKKDVESYKMSSDSEYFIDDDSSDYYSDDDDDYDGEEDTMDEEQLNKYRKFLYSLFPSKNLSDKINDYDNLKKVIKEDIKENSEVNILKPRTTKKEKVSNKDTNDIIVVDDKKEYKTSSDDSDSYVSSSDEENYEESMENNMNFNIVFTVPGLSRDEESETETESESEAESEKDVEDTKDTKDTEENTKKTDKTPDISLDSDTEQSFRDIIQSLNNKNKNSDKEAFNKLEKYLDREREKKNKQKKEMEKKKKNKNTKIFKKLVKEKNKLNDYKYFSKLSIEKQEYILEEIRNINKETETIKPYRLSLIETDIPTKYKAVAMKKVNSLRYLDPSSGEYYKIKQWVDTFMSIPFGNYSNLPVCMDDGIDKCKEFMCNAKKTLDNAIYGMNDAKMQIMQMLGQLISNPSSVGTAIAIKGPPGTGKTSIVKEGISKILNRPFEFIALGGATDSSFLEGHSYTYEGSSWGKIVDILIKSKTMNPVIYFDELDKISDTPKGEEIAGILTHLTDTTQNSQFHDKYFSDIDFDLSKVLFIFSYNDESKVNPILKDRMYRINTNGYEKKDKVIIAKDYLIPKIIENLKFDKKDVEITNNSLEYIISNLTEKEKGVRNLKRCLEIIYTKLNLYRLMKLDDNEKLFDDEDTIKVEFPFKVTKDIVEKLIKVEEEDKWYRHIYT